MFALETIHDFSEKQSRIFKVACYDDKTVFDVYIDLLRN